MCKGVVLYCNVLYCIDSDETVVLSVPDNQTLPSGDSATLTCQFSSDASTPVNVTWYFNDGEVCRLMAVECFIKSLYEICFLLATVLQTMCFLLHTKNILIIAAHSDSTQHV